MVAGSDLEQMAIRRTVPAGLVTTLLRLAPNPPNPFLHGSSIVTPTNLAVDTLAPVLTPTTTAGPTEKKPSNHPIPLTLHPIMIVYMMNHTPADLQKNPTGPPLPTRMIPGSRGHPRKRGTTTTSTTSYIAWERSSTQPVPVDFEERPRQHHSSHHSSTNSNSTSRRPSNWVEEDRAG